MKKHPLLLILLSIAIFPALANAQADIHSVDFKNFTYSAFCIGDTPENVTVKDGEFTREKQENGYVDRFYFGVRDIAFGDLTGDGKDEAVVLSVCNTGGTGNFTEGFIYGMQAGKAKLLARIPGGDRGYGGLRSTAVENGLVSVESNDAGETGAACCPEFIVTTKYKLSGGKIVQVGSASKREAVPTKRLSFERGRSSATMTANIPGGEAVRYIVGARVGQKLTVTSEAKNADIRIVEISDAPRTANGISASLPNSGDFTIEVTNTSETGSRYTITITIK